MNYMVLTLKANLFPYRFKIKDQLPVELSFSVSRPAGLPRHVIVSVDISGTGFSFSDQTNVARQHFDLGVLENDFSKGWKIPIYPISDEPTHASLLIVAKEFEYDEHYPLSSAKKELELILD